MTVAMATTGRVSRPSVTYDDRDQASHPNDGNDVRRFGLLAFEAILMHSDAKA